MSESLYQTYSQRTPANGYRFHLLSPGSTNPKMKKEARNLGLDPVALSLAPFNVSGAGNVCPLASPGCSAVCLNYAGRGQMSNVQRARIQKTRFWFSDRDGFLELLTRDLERAQQRASKKGLQSVARLNVFSDVLWERFLDLERFQIQFYDYSKIPARLGNVPSNYYLTFSLSEKNEPDGQRALSRGFNIAVPFRERPKRFWGFPVIDGDTHDYRFLDPQPAVIGLKPKGTGPGRYLGLRERRLRHLCPGVHFGSVHGIPAAGSETLCGLAGLGRLRRILR